MACYLGIYGILSRLTKSTDHPSTVEGGPGYLQPDSTSTCKPVSILRSDLVTG